MDILTLPLNDTKRPNGAAIQPRGRAAEGDARPSLAAIACCAALRGNTRLANRRTVAAARSVGGNTSVCCGCASIFYVRSYVSGAAISTTPCCA
jgi:hypothetical protein